MESENKKWPVSESERDDESMEFTCVKKNNIMIILLIPKQIADRLDNMFKAGAR